MQNQLLVRIGARLVALDLSDNEASELVGNRSLIRDMKRRAAKNKNVRVRSDTLFKLAEVLKTTVPYLMAQTNDPSLDAITSHPIPVHSALTVTAWAESRPGARCIVPTMAVGPRAFAFVMADSSMDGPPGDGPNIKIGDLLVIDPVIAPENGDAVLAIVRGDPFVRQYGQRLRDDGQTIAYLHALHPRWPDVDLTDAPDELVGTVVEHRRSFTPRRRFFMYL